MPRDIGTSIGVKLTRTGSSVRPPEVLHDLRRVPVDAADAVRRGVAHHLAAEQVRLRRLAGAAGARRGDHHDVRRHQPGRDRGRHGEGRDRRVAAGYGDPACPAEGVALTRQLGEAVGPRAGVLTAVEGRPLRRVPRAGSRRRSRRPASAREAPRRPPPTRRAAAPGTRRRGRSGSRPWSPASTRSASGVRCGWRDPSLPPALLPAVTAPTSTSGCARSRRSSSPPAYPLAPATATLIELMLHDHTELHVHPLSGHRRATGRGGRGPSVDATRFWSWRDWTSRRTSSTSATSRSGSATCSPTATPPPTCRPAPTGARTTCCGTSGRCSTSGPGW